MAELVGVLRPKSGARHGASAPLTTCFHMLTSLESSTELKGFNVDLLVIEHVQFNKQLVPYHGKISLLRSSLSSLSFLSHFSPLPPTPSPLLLSQV